MKWRYEKGFLFFKTVRQLTLSGTHIQILIGKPWASAQTTEESFDSLDDAQRFILAELGAWKAEGFTLVDESGPVPTDAAPEPLTSEGQQTDETASAQPDSDEVISDAPRYPAPDSLVSPGRIHVDRHKILVGEQAGWSTRAGEVCDWKMALALKAGAPAVPDKVGERWPKLATRLATLRICPTQEDGEHVESDALGMSFYPSDFVVAYYRTFDELRIVTKDGEWTAAFPMDPPYRQPVHRWVADVHLMDRILLATIGATEAEVVTCMEVFQMAPGIISSLLNAEPVDLEGLSKDLDFLEQGTAVADDTGHALAEALAALEDDGVYDLPILGRTQRLTLPALHLPAPEARFGTNPATGARLENPGNERMTIDLPPYPVWWVLGPTLPEVPHFPG